MKKISLIAAIFGLVLTSCETDFEINADWKETTIVYGLLDASKDTQYVKINRAFLCECSAEKIAEEYADSINVDPNDLEVKLHKIKLGDTLMSITLEDTLLDKEDGDFASDKNIIFWAAHDSISNFLNDDCQYALTINNKNSGNQVSSNTEIIDGFSFRTFNENYPLGFYNPFVQDSLQFQDKTVDWYKSDNGEIYQLDLKFYYTENGVLKSLVWKQPLVSYTGISMQRTLESPKFFSFLRNNLNADNDDLIRMFVSIDLIMTVGSEDLHTYVRVNEPITGIVQERPVFTNINNGIGVFASRYVYTKNNMTLTQCTRKYLIDELDRGFVENPLLELINCNP
ncbi:MAG: hypothetical protein CMD16_04815 [Flavobacteriales bacterium]|nr:hypothetical protein [Flavobacteriales bacterium]|tara:strand:- start:3860 stop:4882 length:1023 start_codon:yes stop_codon:yes gene_type:complete